MEIAKLYSLRRPAEWKKFLLLPRDANSTSNAADLDAAGSLSDGTVAKEKMLSLCGHTSSN